MINSQSNRSRKEIRKSHILNLLEKYYELPLFIYSKLYERIKEEYVLTGNLNHNEMNLLGIDPMIEYHNLTYSFYDMCMELFNTINEGKLDQEIEEYMKDVFQLYGDTYCYERFNLPFNKEKIEEVTYWSEKEAKEYIDKMINIEHPNFAKEYNYSEERIQELNEWAIEHAKSRVEEGICLDDYSNVVKDVSEHITNTIDRISHKITLFNDIPLDINRTKGIILIYFMFDHESFNLFDDRPKEYIRADLLKLYIFMKRNRIPLGYIPCNEYNDGIDNIYDIYREYDYRWFGMNESERFLQYTEDPTKEVETEDQEEEQYDPPIPELELNRLKEDNREI